LAILSIKLHQNIFNSSQIYLLLGWYKVKTWFWENLPSLEAIKLPVLK